MGTIVALAPIHISQAGNKWDISAGVRNNNMVLHAIDSNVHVTSFIYLGLYIH